MTASMRCFQMLTLSGGFLFLPDLALAQRPLPTLTKADAAHLKQSLPAEATAKPAQPRGLLIYNFIFGISKLVHDPRDKETLLILNSMT
jgi:hypothetical protein